mmetsp:Transcript_18269/g.21085  ORF Transcript_18269/g.21085 Transcript_18269/m.21085 type:complete len:107 (+) Transcript_18269:127-447(+)
MSSKAQNIVFSPAVKAGIAKMKYDIFGTLPQLNQKSGFKHLKKMHKGPYVARYYPEPIAKSARLAIPGFKTELEERRREKVDFLRRKAKGAPKKGSGKRSKKKGGK